MSNEPVALAAAVRAVLLAVMAFGVGLTAAQVAAVGIAVELVAGLFVRARVVPNGHIIEVESPEEAFDLLTRDSDGN